MGQKRDLGVEKATVGCYRERGVEKARRGPAGGVMSNFSYPQSAGQSCNFYDTVESFCRFCIVPEDVQTKKGLTFKDLGRVH